MAFYKRGFSLIELMVVIAIVGILTAIATPVYQEYMTRVRVAKAVDYVMDNYKDPLVQYYNANNTFPYNSPVTDSNPAPGITAVQYFAGWPTTVWILAVLDNNYLGLPPGDPNQLIILLGYNQDSGSIDVFCGSWTPASFNTYVNLKYLPNSCQGDGLFMLEPNYH